jgi:glutathione S-transferase
MLQVYADPITFNSRKVLAGLDLLGTPFEFRYVNFLAGGHKDPDFLCINPNGAVPTIVDGDFILTESNAILQYAADLSGGEKHYPRDLKARADVNRWMLWEASTWAPSCYVYMVEYVVKTILNAPIDQAAVDKETPNWHRLASILDARLAKSGWIVGDGVTIADIAIAAPMHLHQMQQLPMVEHPNLSRWITAIEQLPSWQRTQRAIDEALNPK